MRANTYYIDGHQRIGRVDRKAEKYIQDAIASVRGETMEHFDIRSKREDREYTTQNRVLYKLFVKSLVNNKMTEKDMRQHILRLAEYIKRKNHINSHGGYTDGRPNTWYDSDETEAKRAYKGYLKYV